MTTLLEESTLDTKARELCQFVLDDPEFNEAQDKISRFMNDGSAKSAYRAWQEKGDELHRMSREGLQPDENDIAQFENLKQAVMENQTAAAFMEAEAYLNGVFGTVTKLLQKTLQLGHLPTEEDMAESGCCGGGGGGGCGCH